MDGLRSWGLGVAAALAALAAFAAMPFDGHAGDGEVLHVGETTALHLDGKGWTFDSSASRAPQRVSVQGAGGSASSQKFSIRGLKAGQVVLVFRKGVKTFRAPLDVLP